MKDGKADVVIIGGGIWGLSTAYHLAQRGAKGVVVLERNSELANETTPQAAGLVGQIRSSKVMTEAIQYSLRLLGEFAQQTGRDCGFKQVGSLLVAFGEERLAAFQEQVRRANEHGVPAQFVDEKEIQRLAPAMRTESVRGAYFIPGDGYVDPQQFALSYGSAAKELGVEVRTGVSVKSILVENGKAVGVETSTGRISAGTVIATAGPWCELLIHPNGGKLPCISIRHQRSITVPTDGIPAWHPVVRVPDLSCYVRPQNGGYLYGFFDPNPTVIDLEKQPASFTTGDIDPPTEIMAEAKRRLEPVFPILGKLAVSEIKRGMTTFAPDGQYVIGPVEGAEGLFAATGCAALGIAGSAAVGKWLAGWTLDGKPGEDLARFAPDRFGANGRDPSWVRHTALTFAGNYYGIQPMVAR